MDDLTEEETKNINIAKEIVEQHRQLSGLLSSEFTCKFMTYMIDHSLYEADIDEQLELSEIIIKADER